MLMMLDSCATVAHFYVLTCVACGVNTLSGGISEIEVSISFSIVFHGLIGV